MSDFKRIKVIFDAKFLNGTGGISRDSNRILNELRDENIDIEMVLGKTLPNFMMRSRDNQGSKVGNKTLKLLFQSQFSVEVPRVDYDWRIIRVHDLFPITNPEWFTLKSRAYFRLAIKSLTAKTIFVCNSDYTRRVLISKFPEYEAKSFTYYCKTDRLTSKCATECDGCRFIRTYFGKFILMVGTNEPRKNYQFIINCVRKFQLDLPVVIVGKEGWKSTSFPKDLIASGKIVRLLNSCDFAISELYKSSSLFVSASFDEGFDIPALEAFERHTPLLLSDCAVHREIYGDLASYFSPFEPNAFFETIRENLNQIWDFGNGVREDKQTLSDKIVRKLNDLTESGDRT